MILSESEKDRIRGLHRAASVIKRPLNEWAAVGSVFDSAKNAMSDYLSGKEGMVPDALQKKAEEVIKKLSPAEQDKVKEGNVESLVNTIMKWVKGESGLLPGDQSKAKAAIKKMVMSGAKKLMGVPKDFDGKIQESRLMNEAGPFQDEVLTPEKGKAVAEKSKSEGLPKCGELLKKQAQDKQREKLDSYKDNPKGAPTGGISRVTVDVTLQALAGPLPPKASGVIAMKDGKPFCRVS